MTDKPQRKLSNAERELLRHLRKPWGNVINKASFYVVFLVGWNREWHPKGPTGATITSLMKKGLIDFEPKPGRIGKLIRIAN